MKADESQAGTLRGWVRGGVARVQISHACRLGCLALWDEFGESQCRTFLFVHWAAEMSVRLRPKTQAWEKQSWASGDWLWEDHGKRGCIYGELWC